MYVKLNYDYRNLKNSEDAQILNTAQKASTLAVLRIFNLTAQLILITVSFKFLNIAAQDHKFVKKQLTKEQYDPLAPINRNTTLPDYGQLYTGSNVRREMTNLIEYSHAPQLPTSPPPMIGEVWRLWHHHARLNQLISKIIVFIYDSFILCLTTNRTLSMCIGICS